MSDLAEKRNKIKLFLLNEEPEEKDEERKGLIHRLKNLVSNCVSMVDIPAVPRASWRTVKSESGEEQLSINGFEGLTQPNQNMTNEELKSLVTDLEKEQQASEPEVESKVSDEVIDGDDDTPSYIEGVFSHLDELSTQNDELKAQLSDIKSQVDKNTESLSTFSFNDKAESDDDNTDSESELVEDESVISIEQIMEEADKLNQSATEYRELKQSGQISQEQFDEKMSDVQSALESLETIASEVA